VGGPRRADFLSVAEYRPREEWDLARRKVRFGKRKIGENDEGEDRRTAAVVNTSLRRLEANRRGVKRGESR